MELIKQRNIKMTETLRDQMKRYKINKFKLQAFKSEFNDERTRNVILNCVFLNRKRSLK